MRSFLFVSVALIMACGSSGSPSTSSPDGGSTSNTPDAGSTTSPTCTDGDTKPCEGVSAGNCDPGVRTCVDGTWTACEGRTQPIPGLCDAPSCAGGENDGCGCRVGMSRECEPYGGDPAKLGHGPCVRGFQACEATATGSAWGACEGEIVPQSEDCSGRNLDCDEGSSGSCACTNGQTRSCAGISTGSCVLGTQSCSNGAWGACVGAVQPIKGKCDAANCAGGPNPGCECVIGAQEPCYTGIYGTQGTGTCVAGSRTCNDLGRWGACLGQTRPLPSCDFDSCTGTPLAGCP